MHNRKHMPLLASASLGQAEPEVNAGCRLPTSEPQGDGTAILLLPANYVQPVVFGGRMAIARAAWDARSFPCVLLWLRCVALSQQDKVAPVV